jgi:hypothetical protein
MPGVAFWIALLLPVASAQAEPARGAYPSANVQFLPAFVPPSTWTCASSTKS